MDEIFSYFTKFWLEMKDQVKAKEDSESHGFIFKPRSFMIEDILKVYDTDIDKKIAFGSMEEDSLVVVML